jgi:hypothetical protein
LRDARRHNVATTRARVAMVVVGDVRAFMPDAVWVNFLDDLWRKDAIVPFAEEAGAFDRPLQWPAAGLPPIPLRAFTLAPDEERERGGAGAGPRARPPPEMLPRGSPAGRAAWAFLLRGETDLGEVKKHLASCNVLPPELQNPPKQGAFLRFLETLPEVEVVRAGRRCSARRRDVL